MYKKQLRFLDWEFGVFFHFGIRTFYEGHKDWDMQEMPASGFNPEQLDCEQWIKTIKDAGATYAMLVCKHHDGFANWDSAYTKYSVAASPWKDGKGDVVREYVNSCRKYGIKVGLYYSPAEFGSAKKEAKEYDDYFINQISELLTNYGKIDYLWFDGCGSEGHTYDTARIVAEIRRLQPEILIFNMWDPDTRWVGNEAGVAPSPNFYTVSELDFSVMTENKDKLGKTAFLPAECDCRMRYANWFYSEKDEDTVKSVDELMGLYYYSVGRGANLLINIGPDRRGLLPDKDAKRLIEFGNEIKRRFENPLKYTVSEKYTYEFEKPVLLNHVVLEEDLTDGEHIEKFEVLLYPTHQGAPIKVFDGDTVGHKRICTFPTFATEKAKISITGKNGEEKLKAANFYYVMPAEQL